MITEEHTKFLIKLRFKFKLQYRTSVHKEKIMSRILFMCMFLGSALALRVNNEPRFRCPQPLSNCIFNDIITGELTE